jgi:hypothetical protein
VADGRAQPVDFTFPLSVEEASVLLGALQGYVASWHQHYKDDAGQSHSPADWEEVRVTTGQLIWRLEEAAAPLGSVVEHSSYAVKRPTHQRLIADSRHEL